MPYNKSSKPRINGTPAPSTSLPRTTWANFPLTPDPYHLAKHTYTLNLIGQVLAHSAESTPILCPVVPLPHSPTPTLLPPAPQSATVLDMSPLTAHQRLKQASRQAEHRARQLRMPPSERPRLSPKNNIPNHVQGIFPADYTSMRTCMEHPERYPNDFRYLFRRAGRPNDPEYVWFDMDGHQLPKRSYPSLVQAISMMLSGKWEDASW